MMPNLPEEVRLFFAAAMAAGYQLRVGRQQMMLFLPPDIQRIGGWNTRQKHWYVLTPKTLDQESVVAKCGFRKKEHPQTGHRWWQLDGADGVGAFHAVVVELTGVPIPGIAFGALEPKLAKPR